MRPPLSVLEVLVGRTRCIELRYLTLAKPTGASTGLRNELHLPQETRRLLRPPAVLRSVTEDETFSCASDRDETIAPLLFHFEALVALLLTLVRRHYFFSQSDEVNEIKLSALCGVDCHQSHAVGFR